MFCVKCGKQVMDGAKFCVMCGAKLPASSGGASPKKTGWQKPAAFPEKEKPVSKDEGRAAVSPVSGPSAGTAKKPISAPAGRAVKAPDADREIQSKLESLLPEKPFMPEPVREKAESPKGLETKPAFAKVEPELKKTPLMEKTESPKGLETNPAFAKVEPELKKTPLMEKTESPKGLETKPAFAKVEPELKKSPPATAPVPPQKRPAPVPANIPGAGPSAEEQPKSSSGIWKVCAIVGIVAGVLLIGLAIVMLLIEAEMEFVIGLGAAAVAVVIFGIISAVKYAKSE